MNKTMKKIIFSAALLITVAAGCSKISDTPVNEEQEVKVEFTVAEKPVLGVQTKAVKTDWAVGDRISIAFKPSGATKVLYDYKLIGKNTRIYNCTALTLEFTESGWIANSLITPPEGFGTYYAIHHRGTVAMTLESEPTNTFNLTGYNGGELMSYTGSYIADNNGIIKLGDITMALDSRLMQISVAEELFSNEGNLYLSEGLDEESGGFVISNPEKTLRLSIYKNWTSDGTPSTLTGYVALRNGSVGLDFSDARIFTFSTDDAYKTGATPVLTYNDDVEDNDYSFCFAYTGGKDMMLSSYTFYIERTPEAGATYTIDYDELYQTVTKSEKRTLAVGKAIRLSPQGWIAR